MAILVLPTAKIDLIPILGILSLLAIFLNIVYKLFLHPLSKVPGPLFAKISGIPSWYHALCGDRHIWIWKLYQIYGIKFRITPNTVLFCDSISCNEIYSSSANVQRSSFYTAMMRKHNEQNTFTTVDPKLHAKKRRLLNLAFTEKSLRASSSFMIAHIDRWINLIAAESKDSDGWTAAKDFSKLASVLVFDIMGDLCFGKSMGIKEPGDNPLKTMPHNIAKLLKFWYPIARSPFLPLFIWLRPRGLDALIDMITPPEILTYDQFVRDSVTERITLQEQLREKSESQQRLDMFHFLQEAKDPETGAPAYNKDELLPEANMLIVAGSGTTAVTISSVFFYLVHDHFKLQKLILEIRSKFQSAEDIIPGTNLQSCIYLKACIDEGMRLTPSGPSEMSREIRKGGMTIAGEFYPAGIIVGCATWAQSRYEIYRDPYVFRPERWIVDKANGVTEESVSQCKLNFLPFGKGPTACPGKNTALQELMLTIARTLYFLDVRKAPGSTSGEGSRDKGWGERDCNNYLVRDAFVSMLEGPMLQFRKRDV